MLDEAHDATMQNQRATATFGVLCQNNERLGKSFKYFSLRKSIHSFIVVLALDSVGIKINKSENQFLQKRSFTTKHNGNALNRYLLSLKKGL